MFSIKLLFALIASILVAVVVQGNEVEDAFKNHEIVPDVLDVAPSQFLKVTYDNKLKVDQGVVLTPTQVKNQPKVEWDADKDDYYTLIMTDPDAPSRAEPKFREFRHWHVANIPGNQIEKGEVLAGYVGSGPPKGTGLHRYIFLLYKQPGKLTLDEPHVSEKSRRDRPKFRAGQFAAKYKLGAPVAGNFYQAEYDDYVPVIHKQLSEDN